MDRRSLQFAQHLELQVKGSNQRHAGGDPKIEGRQEESRFFALLPPSFGEMPCRTPCRVRRLSLRSTGWWKNCLTKPTSTEPPVDAIALAQGHLDMEICLDARQPQRGEHSGRQERSRSILRPEPTEERHQWTVAHEIGEHLKVRLLERLRWPAEETRAMTGESLANLFAYHLLVPGHWFAADVRELGFDLLQLKQRYRTSSHEVIAWRLPRSAGLIDCYYYRQRSYIAAQEQCLADAAPFGAGGGEVSAAGPSDRRAWAGRWKRLDRPGLARASIGLATRDTGSVVEEPWPEA